jgi:asparagine synthetase B (glutamine-hydrolysing)
VPDTGRRRLSSAAFDSISLFDAAGQGCALQRAFASRWQGVDSFTSAAKPWFDEAGHFDRVNQALYLDMQLLLSGNNLVKPDRMGMAVSIEARTPFLDWRMMEFAFRIARQHQAAGRQRQEALVQEGAAPLIGDDLAHRKKQMFTVPIGSGSGMRATPGFAARCKAATCWPACSRRRRSGACSTSTVTAAPTTRASCGRWRRWRCGRKGRAHDATHAGAARGLWRRPHSNGAAGDEGTARAATGY